MNENNNHIFRSSDNDFNVNGNINLFNNNNIQKMKNNIAFSQIKMNNINNIRRNYINNF